MNKKGIIQKIETKPYNDTTIWTIHIDSEKFSIFSKEFPYAEGDEIEFEYEKKGSYNNIKHIKSDRNTSYIPKKEDMERVHSIFLMDPIMAKTTLMRCAVDVCLKRGTFSDEEIQAQYQRFINLLNIDLL